MSVIADSDFGARVRRRLSDETVIWLTTTGADGTPQPNPVWFLWDDDTFLVYNANNAKRLEHVAVRPQVSLNFDSNGHGGDIVVFSGVAEQTLDVPSPDNNEEYVTKYRSAIAAMGSDPRQFAETYSVPMRIRVTKVRGF